jgi:hypothetical protein
MAIRPMVPSIAMRVAKVLFRCRSPRHLQRFPSGLKCVARAIFSIEWPAASAHECANACRASRRLRLPVHGNGYAAFDKLDTLPGPDPDCIAEVACMRVRSKFFDIHAPNGQVVAREAHDRKFRMPLPLDAEATRTRLASRLYDESEMVSGRRLNSGLSLLRGASSLADIRIDRMDILRRQV